MDQVLATRATLSILSAVLDGQGKTEAAQSINMVLDLEAAGDNVDQHLADIADQVRAGNLDDWTAIQLRIQEQVDQFLS